MSENKLIKKNSENMGKFTQQRFSIKLSLYLKEKHS